MSIDCILNIKFHNQYTQNKRIEHRNKLITFKSNKFERTPSNGDETSFSGEYKAIIIDSVPFKAQPIEPKILYDNKNWIKKVIFPNPISLKEVSEFLLRPDINTDITCFNPLDIKKLATTKFADTKIKELLGHGTSACAFLMEK